MNKTLAKILAIVGAIAAAAALIVIFREKIADCIDCVRAKCCKKAEEPEITEEPEEEPEVIEEAVEEPAE